MKHVQLFEQFINEAANSNMDAIVGPVMETATNEGMIHVGGNKWPMGAELLARVIVDYLDNNLILPSNANKKKITEEIKQLIIDSTF